MAYPLLDDDLKSIRVAFGTCPGNSSMQFGERFWQGFFFGVIIFFVVSKYIRSYKKKRGMRKMKSAYLSKDRGYGGSLLDENENSNGRYRKQRTHGLFEEIEKRNGFDVDDNTNTNTFSEDFDHVEHNSDGKAEGSSYVNNSDENTENHVFENTSYGNHSSQHSVGKQSVNIQEHKKEHNSNNLLAGRNYSLGNYNTGTGSQGSTSSRHYSLGGQPSLSGRSFSGSKSSTNNLATSNTTESSLSGLNTNEIVA